jgi:[acyl-carrier-protein] S-malonyltransferase
MKAYVFPGQGSQFVGMGKNLYYSNSKAKELFDKANEIIGFNITDIMFNGTDVNFFTFGNNLYVS